MISNRARSLISFQSAAVMPWFDIILIRWAQRGGRPRPIIFLIPPWHIRVAGQIRVRGDMRADGIRARLGSTRISHPLAYPHLLEYPI